jgi:regulator of cell morphogenesis and NO signaling
MIDARKTVGEIASSMPSAMRVFERHGIDYCCGGQRTLVGVCAEHGLPVERIVEELEASSSPSLPPVPRFDDLAELVDHLVSTHHTFTRTELGRLVPLAEKVERVHVARHPELARVRELVQLLAADLGPHLIKEERILFPYFIALEEATVAKLAQPWAPFGTVTRPIGAMHHEHEAVASLLRELRGTTTAYVVPEDACESYRTLYSGLEALERDLHEHIHLENNVAFPAAEKLERELSGAQN